MAKWKRVVGISKDPVGKSRVYKTSFSKREAQRRWREKNRPKGIIRVHKSIEKNTGKRVKHSTDYWTERRLLSLVRQGIIVPEYDDEKKHNP